MNGFKFTGNIILKAQIYYESYSSDVALNSNQCFVLLLVDEYNRENRELFKSL